MRVWLHVSDSQPASASPCWLVIGCWRGLAGVHVKLAQESWPAEGVRAACPPPARLCGSALEPCKYAKRGGVWRSASPPCPASQLQPRLPYRCEATQFDGYTKERVSLTELHRFPVGAMRQGVACVAGTSPRARLAPCKPCRLWQLAPGPDGAICPHHLRLVRGWVHDLRPLAAPALDLHPVLPPSRFNAGQPEQAVPDAGDGAERNQQPGWGAQGGWAGAGRAGARCSAAAREGTTANPCSLSACCNQHVCTAACSSACYSHVQLAGVQFGPPFLHDATFARWLAFSLSFEVH